MKDIQSRKLSNNDYLTDNDINVDDIMLISRYGGGGNGVVANSNKLDNHTSDYFVSQNDLTAFKNLSLPYCKATRTQNPTVSFTKSQGTTLTWSTFTTSTTGTEYFEMQSDRHIKFLISGVYLIQFYAPVKSFTTNLSISIAGGGSGNANTLVLFTDNYVPYNTLHWITTAYGGQMMSTSVQTYSNTDGSITFYIEDWAKPHIFITRLGNY